MSKALELATEIEDVKYKGWRDNFDSEVATELRRLAAVEQELEALKRANPVTILELLEENAMLVDALKIAKNHVLELCESCNVPLPEASMMKFDAAIAKAEGKA